MDSDETDPRTGLEAFHRCLMASMIDDGTINRPQIRLSDKHYCQKANIDGVDYVGLGQAINSLNDPRDLKAITGRKRALYLLQIGNLRPLQCNPAPDHERPDLMGDVDLGEQFWAQVWWFGYSGHDRSASAEWQDWLLQGGVMVPASDVRRQAELARRTYQIGEERRCRSTFQYLWPVTHALAWIISRSENTVAEVGKAIDASSGIEGEPFTAWEMLIDIADEHLAPDETTYRDTLQRAFDLLAPQLQSGKTPAWWWNDNGAKLTEIGVTEMMAASLVEDTNTCGLLGVGKDLAAFVLVRQDDIKALWPAMPTGPQAHEEQKSSRFSGSHMKVPDYSGDAAPDPWMTIAEVVRWVAYLGGPQVKYGSEVIGRGVWIDHGDLSGDDLRTLQDSAQKVRAALADGKITARGINGHEKPEVIDSAWWSMNTYGPAVSWIDFPDPYQRVIVKRSEVTALWPASPDPMNTNIQECAPQTEQKRSRGRPKGSGSYAEADAPLLAEMRQLIAGQEAFSPDGAAKMIAHKAKGGGTLESRANRLARRYSQSENN